MRIVYLLPWYVEEQLAPPAEVRYLLNLAGALARAEGPAVHVKVVAFGPTSCETLLGPGVVLQVLETEVRPDQAEDLLSWELPDALHEADLLHIYQPGSQTGQIGLLTARMAHRPVCVTDHGSTGRALGAALHLHALAQGLVNAAQCTSPALIPPVPTYHIPPCIDTTFWTPPREVVGRDRYLCVAPLLPEKGIDRLLEALPPGAPLTVCGQAHDRTYARELRRRARGKAVEWVADTSAEVRRDLYRKSWALVFPAVHQDCHGAGHPVPEWTGLVLLEAMACGTALIAARLGCLAELVEDGGTGLLFDTPAQLHQHLQCCRGPSQEALRLACNGQRHIRERHAWDVVGRQVAQVYRHLLDHEGQAA